ncbi:MAG: TasA family protein [Dethiobacteria bacterium]|jgi:predicted ribosomally synthesized peptide with SipW-like signal peptide
MRSKMLIGVLVFALAAAVIGGATMAWFTDSDVSDDVTFSAGTLLIDLHEDISYEELDVDNLNPGDEKEWKIIVENKGTKNLVHKVVICWDDILGIERDDVYFGDREGYGTNPLSEAIEFKVTGQGEYQPDIVLTQGTLAGKPKPLDYNYEVKLAPGEEYTYKIYAKFPGEESGNEYQGSQLKAAFIALARQWQEGAVYPEYKCPFGEGETEGIKSFEISNWRFEKLTNADSKDITYKCTVDIYKVIDVYEKEFTGKKDVTLNIQQKINDEFDDILKQPATALVEFKDGTKNNAEFITNAPKYPIESGNYYKVTVVIDGVKRTIEGVYTGTTRPR